ncbi:hypothetical protein DRE_00929 [Drechslerella stenobrocha 248]|uniref:F-box domain-containing protein n=1 Tax=Drechslerella stenobrocha 248 TaxID=1043628 RepID=W7I7B7_9PEZI|nr:hypothetical protein DRE_00929 [Drechslerella stenobrocha 248]
MDTPATICSSIGPLIELKQLTSQLDKLLADGARECSNASETSAGKEMEICWTLAETARVKETLCEGVQSLGELTLPSKPSAGSQQIHYSFLNFPREIQREITAYLPGIDALRSLSNTCRNLFYLIRNDNHLWWYFHKRTGNPKYAQPKGS